MRALVKEKPNEGYELKHDMKIPEIEVIFVQYKSFLFILSHFCSF